VVAPSHFGYPSALFLWTFIQKGYKSPTLNICKEASAKLLLGVLIYVVYHVYVMYFSYLYIFSEQLLQTEYCVNLGWIRQGKSWGWLRKECARSQVPNWNTAVMELLVESSPRVWLMIESFSSWRTNEKAG
jgi:hypothetical protein